MTHNPTTLFAGMPFIEMVQIKLKLKIVMFQRRSLVLGETNYPNIIVCVANIANEAANTASSVN